MKSFVTPNGKTIQLVRDPRTFHIMIQFAEGGELPEVLQGLFTHEKTAEIAINKYLDTKTKKKNG